MAENLSVERDGGLDRVDDELLEAAAQAGDGNVDLMDWDILGACLGGPQVGMPPEGCTAAQFDLSDFNLDGDVDLLDFAEFQVHFVTPGGP